MAFAFSDTKFLLKEGNLKIGSFAAGISTITPATDIEDLFTGEFFGYIRMGTIEEQLADQFAEYMANTPHIRVRQDLIQRDFGLNFTANQVDADTLELIMNATTATSGGVTQVHIGSDAPVKARNGYLLISELVDGTAFKMAIYNGEVVTDSKNAARDGSNHADRAVQVRAFEGDPWIADPTLDKTKSYGLYQIGDPTS